VLISLVFYALVSVDALHVCGNYCGPSWCNAEAIDESKCDDSVDPETWSATGVSCADACCKSHDICCGHGDRTVCNTNLVDCLSNCNPLSATCTLHGVPVPAGGIEAAMGIVENWCCGSPCPGSAEAEAMAVTAQPAAPLARPSGATSTLLCMGHDGTAENVTLSSVDLSSGAKVSIGSYPSPPAALEALGLAYDAGSGQALLVTDDAILTVDAASGIPISTFPQEELSPIVSIGVHPNETNPGAPSTIFGIQASGVAQPTLSLVEVDREAQVTKTLLVLNVSGFVRAAYYAWRMSHYCVIVAHASGDVMVFLDTQARAVHSMNPVQQGIQIRALAINYATHNVYALVSDRTSSDKAFSLAIVHMNGMLQQKLMTMDQRPFVHVPYNAPAVVDNAANLMHVAVLRGTSAPSHDLEPLLATFDLNQNGTLTTVPLHHGTGALALRSAQS
jgi:hypothetical protein